MKNSSQTNTIAAIQLLNLSHFIDEYFFGFPQWATNHFGTTTKTYYLASHLALILIIGTIVLGIKKGSKTALFLGLSTQTIFLTNGLFHVTTTFIFSEYSPGLLSQIIILPASVLSYKTVHGTKMLSKKELIYSVLLGTVASGLIISSLWLNIRW